MILAAGLGTRLKPWTLEHPKALVPVDGIPMLERVILKLKSQGFDEIVVNVHHFAGQITDFLDSKDFGIKISISDERGGLLDTGGGLVHARHLLEGEPFLVHNVDILSNADLSALMHFHESEGNDVTLLTSDRKSSRKLLFDEDGSLTVAKFPSRKDDYDVAQWEHFCHVMGRKAGLNVADTRTIDGEDYHILHSKRLDRNSDGRRIHFASALTLLGLTDGDNASTGYGYTDIVDFIVQHGSNVERNLEELYRRVAFYIIVGNSDDHFRNHGFLLTRKGWELSPAYDINPTLADNQSLLINRSTSESDLNILLASAGEYMLSSDKAEGIITEVKTAMKSWRTEARRLGLPQRDIDMFAPRFDKWIE